MKKFFAVLMFVMAISGSAFADCAADFDGDGTIGFADFVDLLRNWGACDGCQHDLNGDNYVNRADMRILLGAWGECEFVDGCASNADCLEGEYCNLNGTNCGATGNGTCDIRPEICLQQWDPVCGCDGNTHSNICWVAAAGSSIDYAGPC